MTGNSSATILDPAVNLDNYVVDLSLITVMDPAAYANLNSDQRLDVRKQFIAQVTAHESELVGGTIPELGAPLPPNCGERYERLQAGTQPTGAKRWRDQDISIATGYPQNTELLAFVNARLATFNQEIRDPRQLGRVIAVDPDDQLLPDTDHPISPVQYVIIDGKIRCIHGFPTVLSEGPGSDTPVVVPDAGGQDHYQLFEVSIDFGPLFKPQVVAEVRFAARA